MLVSDALKKKGTEVVTTKPETSIVDITHVLRGKGIGAVVVVGQTGGVSGIITERDIVHGIAMHGDRALSLPARQLMTVNMATCRLDDPIEKAMQQMIDHACRHLPVVEHGELQGLVSMSDVIKLRLEQLQSVAAASEKSDVDDHSDGWPVTA